MQDAALDVFVEVAAGTLAADVVVAVAGTDAAAALLPTSDVTPKAVFLIPWLTPSACPLVFQEVSKMTLQEAFPHTILPRPL
jgi:hypothetical protein